MSFLDDDVVIIHCARTPMGRSKNGVFRYVRAEDLSAGLVNALLARNPAVDPAHPERNRPGALYMGRVREVDPAIVLESARWGDSMAARTNNPFTRADFLTELNRY